MDDPDAMEDRKMKEEEPSTDFNANVIMKAIEQETVRLQCNECSCSYTTVGSLNRHKRTEHTEFNWLYKCPFCLDRVGYVNDFDLMKHIRCDHGLEEYTKRSLAAKDIRIQKAIRCVQCNVFLSTGREAVKHDVEPCSVKDYACPVEECGVMGFRHQSELLKHWREVHPESWKRRTQFPFGEDQIVSDEEH
ncbi:hypothetical protein L596_016065 [Steinernema carpocapsae]|uniref:C2H2-type domain-containing protein n=1 Tax=Steinernema carpocapsae TaxID=34508 RepID=A0A4V6A3A1_STECR|nr:hypothetical protein L596_016065 [Steinernema carpocapsae]